MDNLTHSLVGIAVAETAVQIRIRKNLIPLRSPLYFISLVANNFPDLDFLYAKFLSGDFGYLLHHRGHTHTLLLGFIQSLCIFLGVQFFFLWKNWRLEKIDRIYLLVIALLGIPLHILLDSWNSYGVHPFWPWDNSWYAMDAVFILEPWFWMSLAAALFFENTKKLRKFFYASVFILSLGLVLFVPLVPWLNKFYYIFFGIIFVWLAWRTKGLQRILIAIFTCIAYVSILVIVSQVTKQKIWSAVGAKKNILDIVRSPAPANPFCWNFFVIRRNPELKTYEVDVGQWNWLGKNFSACGSISFLENPNAVLSPPNNQKDTDTITWRGIWRSSIAEFSQNNRENCHFSAFLRFARVPYWQDLGNALYFGDLRFDRNQEKGFAEFLVDKSAICPKWLPPWEKQRKDIFDIAE